MTMIGSFLGVFFRLMVASSSARAGSAKLRALIASDQAILQSLPPGSLAAIQLDARIQATVTVYATGLVLPKARRNAAVMVVVWVGFLAVALALALKSNASEGDQFVYSLAAGFFAATVGVYVRVLFHRNLVLATADPDAVPVD